MPRHTHEKTVFHPSDTYQCGRREQQAHFRSSVTDTSRCRRAEGNALGGDRAPTKEDGLSESQQSMDSPWRRDAF